MNDAFTERFTKRIILRQQERLDALEAERDNHGWRITALEVNQSNHNSIAHGELEARLDALEANQANHGGNIQALEARQLPVDWHGEKTMASHEVRLDRIEEAQANLVWQHGERLEVLKESHEVRLGRIETILAATWNSLTDLRSKS